VLRQYSIGSRVINEYGTIGGRRIHRVNESIQRKPTPVPLCSPQIPHDLTWDRTWATGKQAHWMGRI
jgi:hypothetical protein